MRVVTFEATDEGKQAFVHLLVAMGSNGGDVRGIEQIRRLGKMLDKIEALGTKESTEVEGVTREGWRLRESGGELWLEGDEYAELTRRMAQVEWLAGAARTVAKSFDLLEKAPERDPAPKPLAEAAD